MKTKFEYKDKKSYKLAVLADHILNIFILIIFISIFGVGAYAVFDTQLVTNESALPDDLKASATPDKEHVSIAKLKEINQDIVGWLHLNDTNIDYPIAQAEDNFKYLTRSYNLEKSVAGTPFVDYRNNFFSDDYTIIYGHRMANEQMFTNIAKYADEEFFKSHQTGELVTENATYQLNVIAYSLVNLSDTSIYNINRFKNGNNTELIEEVYRTASNKSESTTGMPTKLILLSTCAKNSAYYRDILLVEAIEV